MADSFFGCNTSLMQGLELDDEPELGEEEEYDALNDETFGADAFQGDWEEDHTRFAEVTENSRTCRNSFNSERDDDLDLEASLSQLVLEGDEENEDEEIGSDIRNKITIPNNIPGRFLYDYYGGYISSPTWSVESGGKESRLYNTKQQQQQPQQKSQPLTSSLSRTQSQVQPLPMQYPRIPTVQELERDLMEKNKQDKYVEKENKTSDVNQTINHEKNHTPAVSNNSNNLNSNSENQFQNLNIQQQNAHSNFSHPPGNNKIPPGFYPGAQNPFNQPHQQYQQQQQEMVMLRNRLHMPGQCFLCPWVRIPHLPTLFPPPNPPPHPHSRLLFQNPRLVALHPMVMFNAKEQHAKQHHLQNLHMYQKQMQNKMQNNQDHMRNGQISRNHHNAGHSQHQRLHNARRGSENYDEYAGLMDNREKRWLLNIQIMQLHTDKPDLDDYYYMAWLKKHEKEKKLKEETRNGLKSDKQNREPFFANNRQPKNDKSHRERKDSEREITATASPRVYVPLQFENSLGKLQCGSVTAPRKIIDLDIFPEPQAEAAPLTSHRDSRKAKKILLELEKLYLLTMNVEDIDNKLVPEVSQSTEETPMSKSKLLEQIMTSYLNEDRFVNFMCIRKGKTLLLRILPHLSHTDHYPHLSNLWCCLIKSISTIVRRDQNDGILLQIYPYFKKWINAVDCTVLYFIASYLLTANQGKKSTRAVSPNSGKSVLSHIITTTFGVSAVSSILSRGEAIYPTLEEKEKLNWTNFILNFIKHMTNLPNLENIPTPLDPLPANVLTVILNRSTGLHIQDYASAKRILTAFNKDKSRSLDN